MACILHIETSTNIMSVALSKDGFLLFEKTDNGDGRNSNAAEHLGGYVSEAMDKLTDDMKLDAVSVSSGPGSYTGLRIGVSMAKGICYGSDAQLISIPTLQLLAVPVLLGHDAELEDDALLCPMIDARRMEVYAAVYDRRLNTVRDEQADIVDHETYRSILDQHKVFFFGNGAHKCKEVINHPNARFIDDITPLAKNMLPLADKRFHLGKTEDVAYFTPHYIKEYQAKMPKKLLP